MQKQTELNNQATEVKVALSQRIVENALAADANIPATGMHLFSRLEDITSRRSLNAWMKSSEALGGLYLDGEECGYDVSTYLDELFKFERVGVCTRNKSVHTLFLSVLRIMMPIDLPDRLYVPFGLRVASRILVGSNGVVPFFFRKLKRGQCTYLLIFFSERYFYPEGRLVEVKASSDFYRNPMNGRRCSSDVEGAVLAIKKGDVVRTTTTKFSAKERITRVDIKKKKMMSSRLKWIMKQFFSEHLAPQSDDALFARLSYDEAAPMLASKCISYNKFLQRMEASCTQLLDHVKGSGLSDEVETIHSFIEDWRTKALTSEGIVRIKNHSFKYSISFKSKFDTFNDALDMMFYGFERAFDRLVKSIFPPIAEI